MRTFLCILLAPLLLLTGSAVHGKVVFRNEYIIDHDGSGWVIDANNDSNGANIALQFGTTFGESISFDTNAQLFSFSDSVTIQGDLEIQGEIVDSDQHTGASGEVLVADGSGKNLWAPLTVTQDVETITSAPALATPAQVSAQLGSITLHRYDGMGGVAITDLTNDPDYPDNPNISTTRTLFESPTDVADNFGYRMHGYILAPQTGNYRFWIASDDNGALYLSTDTNPANKVSIATVPGYTASREWTKYPQQQSALIPLVAGQAYYVEALMKEQGGLDNLAVGWQLPNSTLQRPIPGSVLSPYFTAVDQHSIASGTDVILVDSSAGPVTLQLPSYVGQERQIVVKRISTDANEITLLPFAGELIAGQSSLEITTSGKIGYILQTDGSNIYIAGQYIP